LKGFKLRAQELFENKIAKQGKNNQDYGTPQSGFEYIAAESRPALFFYNIYQVKDNKKGI
jgi:hypothetical protein